MEKSLNLKSKNKNIFSIKFPEMFPYKNGFDLMVIYLAWAKSTRNKSKQIKLIAFVANENKLKKFFIQNFTYSNVPFFCIDINNANTFYALKIK